MIRRTPALSRCRRPTLQYGWSAMYRSWHHRPFPLFPFFNLLLDPIRRRFLVVAVAIPLSVSLCRPPLMAGPLHLHSILGTPPTIEALNYSRSRRKKKTMVVLSSLATIEIGQDAIEEGGITTLVETIEDGSNKGK
ncbi:uncharacterized protein LOC130993303 [Salvia miltiorrhiza]|uniref:uncharacterized protein LOC130993303 n=1 Tax=Salvia miltiorrhiza TaxID=226208 RepID=UPI0025ACD8EA|nr:uncharacterized protein LOC130993303 [Salvia miltiorrhiza]